MANLPAALQRMTPLQRAVFALQEARAQLDGLRQAQREPIAILGFGCRFPGGADSPDTYWRLLRDGVDAVSEVPPERWDIDAWYDPDPRAPGRMYSRWGAFLPGIDLFEPELFGIAPREAAAMDPQQRLLLEVAWEAIERSGHAPDRLAGSATGVFVGLMNSDWARLTADAADDPGSLASHIGTGGAASVIAGRLSYVFGLQGPSLVVDTACSSSLVAIHLACQSLRAGECRMALAGGVNLILSPATTVLECRARMLAADGRCKTFDAAADGFVRGEGCGVVVLKRLADARADGDPILGVILGSAVNQDGRSSGLTAPHGPSQEAVIRGALAAASLEPAAVGYVEAHGTGTALGDPIEVAALRAVFGAGRPAGQPLAVASVKTNFGHLEAAAGVAGLLKALLMLRHGEIPPHLHLRQLNPNLSLDGMVVPATGPLPWSGPGPRVAGVSSFGFSGTNAHVLLAEAPAPAPAETAEEHERHLLVLSARTAEGLAALAERWRDHLAALAPEHLAAACHTAAVGRSHLRHRLAVAGSTPRDLAGALAGAASVPSAGHGANAGGQAAAAPPVAPTSPGEAAPVAASSTGGDPGRRPRHAASRGPWRGVADRPPRIAFLFSGQGAQRSAMGRGLFATQPAFRRTLERCDKCLRDAGFGGPGGEALLSVLYPAADDSAGVADGAASALHDTRWAQPALFAVEVALAELWRSWGIRPAALLGHSVGEIAAACVAGCLSLDDALRLVTERAGRMGELPAGGGMAAVFAAEDEVRAILASTGGGTVEVAAVNGRRGVVISGPAAELEAVLAALHSRQVEVRRLQVSHAFHSAAVEPILDGFELAVRGLGFSPPQSPLVSNVTGRPFGPGEAPDAGYWRRHLRQPVRFAAGLEALVAMGCDTFLEIGPGTDLLAIVRREELPVGGPLVPSLRAGRDDVATLLDAAGALYVAGAEIDWQVFGSRGGDRAPRRRDAPTYPFQRQRCWLDLPGLGRGGKAAPGQAATTPVTGEAAAGCLWQPVWEERAPQAAHAAPPSGPARGRAVWLLLADRGGFAGALGDRLTAIGERVVVAGPPGGPPGAEDFARWLKRCGGPCRVVHLRSLDLAGDDLSADGQERCCGSVLSLVRTAAARPGAVLGCWLVSRHAQAVLPGERLDGLPVAPLWGLGRTIALEHPELWSGIVDLDDASTAEAEALARLLVAGRGTDGSGESNGNGSDDQLALRAGRTFVPRLRRLSPAARPPQAPALTVPADSTCLITGGLGGIGLRLARWLAEHGARHLVLVSRRGLARPDGPPEPAAKAIEAIEALGTRVQVERGDVAVADDLARICASIEASAAPLWGVFHAAGVLQDGVLSGMSWERCARVLAPKVSGAWNLHRATAGRPLGAFVLFSSAASLLGAAGQGSYAAANAFLDALACHRRARGLPAVSVSWGPWEGEGMAASPSGGRRAPGLARLHADEALAVLARAIDGPLPHLAAMPADGAALAARATGREPALLADWLRALQTADGGAAAQQPPAAPPSMRQRLRGAPPHLRGGLLAEHLRGEVARVLGMPPAQLPERQGFSELGMDSLLAIELKNRLQTALEVALPATLALNHPSLESLMAAISPLLLAEPFAAGATAAEGGPSGYSSTGAAAATATATDLDALPDDLIAEMLGAELREAGY